jgi:hypothetical protein
MRWTPVRVPATASYAPVIFVEAPLQLGDGLVSMAARCRSDCNGLWTANCGLRRNVVGYGGAAWLNAPRGWVMEYSQSILSGAPMVLSIYQQLSCATSV